MVQEIMDNKNFAVQLSACFESTKTIMWYLNRKGHKEADT